MAIYHTVFPSIVGKLILIANDHALLAILWEHEKANRVKIGAGSENKSNPVLEAAKKQLSDYFGGKRKSFDIPLEFIGTPFQKDVWAALKDIPYGKTLSYAQLAKQIGRPSAVRAAAGAIGRNPISIIVPCHRVIGANGKLTGFAGGLKAKETLLKLESF